MDGQIRRTPRLAKLAPVTKVVPTAGPPLKRQPTRDALLLPAPAAANAVATFGTASSELRQKARGGRGLAHSALPTIPIVRIGTRTKMAREEPAATLRWKRNDESLQTAAIISARNTAQTLSA